MRKLYWFLALVVLAGLVLSACGAAAPFEIGSVLVCPKNYDPGTSVCTEKQSAEQVVDLSLNQELPAAYIGVGEVGVYRNTSETYAMYTDVGYNPTPSTYVRIYPETQQSVISDIDPVACGGTYNDVNCVKALGNVTLMGFQKFGSSYILDYSYNFDTKNLKALYEVGGRDQLMKLFNDRSRDTFRDSKDIDPAKYISGEIGRPDVAENWLGKLKTSEYMTSWQYFNLFTFKDLSVRYFEPESTGAGGSESSSQVLEDQAFTDFLTKKDLFCAQYTPGSSLRAECDRTFVCSQDNKTCYFGSAIIPIDLITATPTSEVIVTP